MFVGVNVSSDTEEDARAFIREFGITYPNGPDTGWGIYMDYFVLGTGVTFFVDREGFIVRRVYHIPSEQQLVAWIEELLTDMPPSDGAK